MSAIDLKDIKPVRQIFHNERIETYVTSVNWEKISYWRENLRTILAFEVLESDLQKPLSEISLEEITKYLAAQPEIRLSDLASSIKENGVRIPLVVLKDGTLLDGNRRFFACSLLNLQNKNGKYSEVLSNIPVWVIDGDNLSEIQKEKILAEANFVPDYKVPWSLDVKALVIKKYYDQCMVDAKSPDEAYAEIQEVYGIKKSEIVSYIETIDLTEEYIDRSIDVKRRFKLRAQVLSKFVYFWEFRNKALKGRGVLEDDELKQVKPLFFKMMENSCFVNIKQVEPMIRSIRHPHLWEILEYSKGTKIDQVEVLYRESKTIRSAEDKVRNFLKWLESIDSEQVSHNTKILLDKISLRVKSFEN